MLILRTTIFSIDSPLLFPFSYPVYYFGLNLLEDSCKKNSGLIGLVPAPSLAALSVVSFYWMLLCLGTYIMVTWFTSDSTVSFFIQSATSNDFVQLALRVATATCLSKQIVVCSFTSLFLRQLVAQSSIVTTPAWKAVAFCPSETCLCILLWYLQIPASVLYWLQAPSVNQTCPFLSWLGQFSPILP